jgi:hypothetical protein
MLLENRIRGLSKKLVNCKDDLEALKLAKKLQTLLYGQIEQLRKKISLYLLERNWSGKWLTLCILFCNVLFS